MLAFLGSHAQSLQYRAPCYDLPSRYNVQAPAVQPSDGHQDLPGAGAINLARSPLGSDRAPGQLVEDPVPQVSPVVLSDVERHLKHRSLVPSYGVIRVQAVADELLRIDVGLAGGGQHLTDPWPLGLVVRLSFPLPGLRRLSLVPAARSRTM